MRLLGRKGGHWVCLALALAGLIVPSASAQVIDSVKRVNQGAALQALLADAALVNAQIPDRLRAYRARVETEMSLAILDSGARERTAQLEQIESDVRFRNPDRYDQRVIGYRNQSVGPTFSLMSIFGGWTTPTLYGNRLQLGVSSATSSNRTISQTGASFAIHPLAANRDAY